MSEGSSSECNQNGVFSHKDQWRGKTRSYYSLGVTSAPGEEGKSDRIRSEPVDCDRCKSATKRYALGVSHGESLDDLEHNGPFISSLAEQ